MNNLISQCPHCQTSFRISQLQLATAQGMARCGACLQVFNARQNLLSQLTEPLSKGTDSTNSILPNFAETSLDLSDLHLDQELKRLAQEDPILNSAHPSTNTPSTERQQAPWESSLEPLEPSLGNLNQDYTNPRDAYDAPVYSNHWSIEDSLKTLDDSPVQLRLKTIRKASWKSLLAWTLLSLLAGAGLLAQYAYYHVETLGTQSQYRPWLGLACPYLGCRLPPKVDVSLIKSSNLVVRSHPEFAGALILEALLYNRATFSQSFPVLEVHFSDVNGQILASRSFQPSEYLAGDLAGHTEMPAQVPIHIALELLDPGEAVVHYSLTFRAPQ